MDYLTDEVFKRYTPLANDIIIFLDNDAFPIADLSTIIQKLETNQLCAVTRIENGDYFPHPCFTMTTCDFWKNNKLNWKFYDSHGLNKARKRWKGHILWNNLPATVQHSNDTGLQLYDFLVTHDIKWYPLLRNNIVELSPDKMLFGVYDSCIYHHGAGSRVVETRAGHINNVSLTDLRNVHKNYTKKIADNPDIVYSLMSESQG